MQVVGSASAATSSSSPSQHNTIINKMESQVRNPHSQVLVHVSIDGAAADGADLVTYND